MKIRRSVIEERYGPRLAQWMGERERVVWDA